MTNEVIQTLDLAGRRYVVVAEVEFCRLTGEPPLPEQNEHGNYPALEAMRMLIAREIIRDRRPLGLSQAGWPAAPASVPKRSTALNAAR